MTKDQEKYAKEQLEFYMEHVYTPKDSMYKLGLNMWLWCKQAQNEFPDEAYIEKLRNDVVNENSRKYV